MFLIIPVMNRLEYTQVCLEKLYTTKPGLPVTPIIVDNGSRPKTANLIDRFKSEIGEVEPAHVIRFQTNRGLAGAVNAGIEKIKELRAHSDDFVGIMHNDCYPFENWAKELELGFLDDEDAAVAIPRTSYANEHSPCVMEIRNRFLKEKPSNKDKIEVEKIKSILKVVYPSGEGEILRTLKANPMRTTYTPEVSSFCMMTKLSFLMKFNGWEECFYPCYCEDKFWALQFSRLGFVSLVANYSFVHHFGNITSDGPGYSFPEMFAASSAKLRDKINELDSAGPKKEKA